jgi:transcriptional regulator NrdR family protein
MASEIIGRMACPECSFHAAHVKIKTDKEGANPYRHCPDCGAQYFTRTKTQADNLLRQIRTGSQTSTQTSDTSSEAEGITPAEAVERTTPPPAQKFKTVFGVQVPV